MIRLVIGNKNYSSWSRRAWLYLKENHVDFEEVPLPAMSVSADCQAQIRRVEAIWTEARERCAARGPWLFGEFGIVDLMFAPAALRFASYGIAVGAVAEDFIQRILDRASVQEWLAAAEADPERIDFIDAIASVGETPMVLG